MHMLARGLLFDSEVALRLVDEAVEDGLRGLESEPSPVPRLRLAQDRPCGCQAANAGSGDALALAYAAVVDAVWTLQARRSAIEGAVPAAPAPEMGAALVLLDEVERRLLGLARLLDPGVVRDSALLRGS
jgi:hypothetical protein